MKQAENHTNSLLLDSYRNMTAMAAGLVRELFTDVGLFVLGSELSVDELVQRFFDALFPLVYNHLVNLGLRDISPATLSACGRRDAGWFHSGGRPPCWPNSLPGRGCPPGSCYRRCTWASR